MNAVRWFSRRRGQGLRAIIAGHATAMLFVLCNAAAVASAAVEPPAGIQSTPPRLGYVDGEVLFWRPGEGDWETAQVNIPLAPGDALATRTGKLELQVGGKSFIRAADGTQLRLVSNEPDFLQIEVSAGHLAVDLRDLRARTTLQIDTPQGVITLAQDGFYRVDVDGSTRVIVRRGGLAMVRPAGGSVADVGTGEAVEITGTDGAQLAALAAPPFDEWDRWNYERAERYISAPRSYALSEDIYGADELDRNGDWRYVSSYGRVWVPNSVPSGWAPYTYGRWAWDPLYGWSWVDYAPWGWAPFHYGRWVYAGYWAWAPGPVLAVPVYSPALVAFFGAPGFSVGFGFGVPAVSWVALGWGEPLIPWWGPVGFIGSPCWWGWGGPRIVNNVVINNNTVINANTVNFYRNTHAPGAVVGVPRDQFNTRSLQSARLTNVNADQLTPLHGKLPVSEPTNFNRAGQSAGARAEFSRQGPQGAQRAGSQALGDSRPDSRAAFESLRGRGSDTATEATRPNVDRPSASTLSSNALRRGETPPSVQGGSRSAPGSFDALRNRGSAAAPNGSANLGRGQAPPPAPSGSTAGRGSFDSLRNRGSATAPNGSTNLSRGQAPPPVPSGSTSARGFDSLRNRGSATAPNGSANLSRGQAPPPVPSGSTSATRSFESLRNRGSAAPRVDSGRASGAVPRSTDLRRGASPPAVQRAPSASGTRSNLSRSSGRTSAASPRLRSAAPPTASAEAFNRARSAPRQARQSDGAAVQAAPSRRTTTASRGSDSRSAVPNTQQYRAASRAAAPAAAPSANLRSFSRGSSGGSFSRSSGGSFRGGSSGGGMSNFGRSMGGGGGGGSGMRAMGGRGLR